MRTYLLQQETQQHLLQLPTTSIDPTAATHIVNKQYVDKNVTPTLQTLSFDKDTGQLNRKVVTNFNVVNQYVDTLINSAEENLGFDIINGTMQIELDKGGNLVYRTTADEVSKLCNE